MKSFCCSAELRFFREYCRQLPADVHGGEEHAEGSERLGDPRGARFGPHLGLDGQENDSDRGHRRGLLAPHHRPWSCLSCRSHHSPSGEFGGREGRYSFSEAKDNPVALLAGLRLGGGVRAAPERRREPDFVHLVHGARQKEVPPTGGDPKVQEEGGGAASSRAWGVR